jgi:hypothetical protein
MYVSAAFTESSAKRSRLRRGLAVRTVTTTQGCRRTVHQLQPRRKLLSAGNDSVARASHRSKYRHLARSIAWTDTLKSKIRTVSTAAFSVHLSGTSARLPSHHRSNRRSSQVGSQLRDNLFCDTIFQRTVRILQNTQRREFFLALQPAATDFANRRKNHIRLRRRFHQQSFPGAR